MPTLASSAALRYSSYNEFDGEGLLMSAGVGIAAGSGSIDDVVARIERLPISWWHV